VRQNLQQIPERCPEFDLDVHPEYASAPFIEPRKCIVPDVPEEDVIISADFSQIEFWIYSWYAKCRRALEIKASGEYLYGAFYEDIWKEPFFNPTGGRSKSNRSKNVPPWKLLVAKSWPLGFIYGRGVPNPSEQGLPIQQSAAKRIHDQFHKDYPEYSLFHRELEFLVNRQGYLQTAFGRLRHFPNPKGQRNEYLAFPGQSTAVDVMLGNALLPLSRLLPLKFGPRSRVLFSVHDSVICNVTIGGSLQKAREAFELVTRTLEAPIPEFDGFNINCEVKIGPSWGACMSWQEYERSRNGSKSQ
jgi:DNA polymerase-1